ncbi:MAG TPA: response regulator transcription factor [Actinocrinis sp.]|nr:response regulator transcription factor [Actinocrinis sp.]
MTAGEPIRILAVDDHVVLREALCDLLSMEPDLQIVAQAGTGPEAVRLAVQYKPDVVLLDIEMPDTDPVATVRRLLADNPALHIIVLSMYDDAQLVRELVSLGVGGYLHKSSRRQTVVTAIRQVEAGGDTITVSVSPQSLRAATASPNSADGPLSPRELEILTAVAGALSNRQIATRLGITEPTVKRHLRNIFEKLDAVSRIDAVNKATALLLIKPQRRPH